MKDTHTLKTLKIAPTILLGFLLFACAPAGRDQASRSANSSVPNAEATSATGSVHEDFSAEAADDSSRAPVTLSAATGARSWEDFVDSPLYADLHNDRSFFLTARGIPWQECARVQICAATYGRSNSFFSLWRPPPPFRAGRPWGLNAAQARRLSSMSHFDYLRQAIADLKATGVPISDSPEDIREDRSHIFLGIEGAYLLNKSGRAQPSTAELKEILTFLKKEKVTYVALVWSNNNIYAGTSRQPARGLTDRGRDLVRLLIEYGFLIDLSHASDKTVFDFYTFTGGRYPLFFSHSSVRSLCPNARNVSDRILNLVKETGGLVGINFYTKYLSCKKRADIADVVDHIAYIHDKAGPEHVALGSDFDGLISLPTGLKKPGQLSSLARLLRRRGLSQKQIEQIFHGNTRNFLSEWRAMKKLDI